MTQRTVSQDAETGFTLTGYLSQLGVLRCALLGTTLVVVLLAIGAPMPSFSDDASAVVRAGVVPALVPLLLAVLLFDTLMARVWLSEVVGAKARHWRRIIVTNLVVVALMVLAWGPFFYNLSTL